MATFLDFAIQGPASSNLGDINFALLKDNQNWLFSISHDDLIAIAKSNGSKIYSDPLLIFEAYKEAIMTCAVEKTQLPPQGKETQITADDVIHAK